MILASIATAATPVQVDAKCPDKTIEYDIRKQAQAAINATSTHQLVSDNTGVIRISLIAAPVRPQGDEEAAPLGISFAVLVRKKAAAGHWDVTTFQGSFVPLDQIATTVRDTILLALK